MTPRQSQIKTLHTKGLTTPQMADDLGLSYQRVRALLRRLSLQPHRARRPSGQGRRSLPRVDYQNAVRQAAALRRSRVAASLKREPFISTKALASILGVSIWTIQNDLRLLQQGRDE